MSKLIARIKILPSDSEVDTENIANSIVNALTMDMKMLAHVREPIAFGINALIADFTLNDSEGQMELLENSIKKVNGVGEIEVINVSRQSVRIK